MSNGTRPVLLQNVSNPDWVVLAVFDEDRSESYPYSEMVSLTGRLYGPGESIGVSAAKYWRPFDGVVTITNNNGEARVSI